MKKQKITTKKAIESVNILHEYIFDGIDLTEAEIQILSYYVERESKNNFYFFAKYVLGFDLLTDQTHKKWADDLVSCLYRKDRIMRLKPRATYKSSLYGVCFILWLWSCVSKELRIFYTSANSLLLAEISDKISQYIEPNQKTVYQLVFGVKKDIEGKNPPKNTEDIFNIVGRSGKGFSLILRTAGGSTVGIHPNIIIVDDPMDKNDRESSTIRKKKTHWMDTLTPLIVPFIQEGKKPLKFILFIATRWHQDDLVNYVLEMDEDEGEWDIEIESIYKEDGTSNYPEFVTDEEILRNKKSIDAVFFSCQYENNPLPEGLQLFNESFLNFVPINRLDFSTGQKACFFDPSQGKESSDFPATIWTHFAANTLTVFDALKERMALHALIRYIALQNKKYGVSLIVFEDNGSSLIEESLLAAHKEVGCHVQIIKVRHSTNKDERIVSMQPEMYSGFCRFLEDWKERYYEMMDQLLFYPVHKNDDYPDVLEMAIAHYKQSHFKFIRYEGMN